MGDASWLGRVKRVLGSFGAGPETKSRSSAYVVAKAQKAPVVRYVDDLLRQVIEQRKTITLRADAGLPDLGNGEHGALTYVPVVNRLKVLSGLYPVTQSQPTEGRFKHSYRGQNYDIAALFDDRAATGSCRLTVAAPAE